MIDKLLLLSAVLLTITIGPSLASTAYRNETFAFRLDIPDGLTVCRDAPSAVDHGPVLLLSRGASCADIERAEGRILVTGTDNAAHEVRTARDLMIMLCGREKSRGDIPPDLTIPGKRTASCRLDMADGRTMIRLFAQTRRGPEVGQWLNYSVSLFTTRPRLEHDLKVLREVLASLKIDELR